MRFKNLQRGLLLFVSACMLAMMLTYLPGSGTPAFAQTGLTIERIWTTDGNNNGKTSFTYGGAIHYWVQINNATGNATRGRFQYEAFLGTVNAGSTEIYDQIFSNITVPTGLT